MLNKTNPCLFILNQVFLSYLNINKLHKLNNTCASILKRTALFPSCIHLSMSLLRHPLCISWYQAAFVKPQGNEMWAMLLEKAFAKFVGSYANLDGGHFAWAWEAMTGTLFKV